MMVERVDYSSDEDFEQAQQAEEYGSCPNCGATVHITDVGNVDGITKCKYCIIPKDLKSKI